MTDDLRALVDELAQCDETPFLSSFLRDRLRDGERRLPQLTALVLVLLAHGRPDHGHELRQSWANHAYPELIELLEKLDGKAELASRRPAKAARR